MSTEYLSYENVNITGGFWKEKQDLVRKTTIWNVYRRFSDTGRFAAFKMNWQEGMPNKPHIFWDSDVAKWLESVAYLTMKQREPELEAIVDEVVDDIAKGQAEDGYFNIYFEMFEPENRFTKRGCHELYCAGHLIEAAIAYDKATGKHKFLEVMLKYAALIQHIFMEEKSAAFTSPGHEEIELALVKLSDYTGDTQWLTLAQYFIDSRGEDNKDVDVHDLGKDEMRGIGIQDHLPVRRQATAEGHSVRASYLYSAMADLALRTGDEGLYNAVNRIFDNIVGRKMYITGSVGSTVHSEAFEEDYHLPNDTAYAETCATLALALFARRMECLTPDAKYADTVERVIYNGFLSGMSLDGKSFFYENAQEINLAERKVVRSAFHINRLTHFPITQRIEVFGCSCCPPNVTRFIPSVGDFIYNYTDDTVYVNQYMESTAALDGLTLTQTTAYPYDGEIFFTLTGGSRKAAFRIPSWCKNYTIRKNGRFIQAPVELGYAVVDMADGDSVQLSLTLAVRRVKANSLVLANRGMSAFTYGPFVMCMEGVDNGGSLGDVRILDGTPTVGTDETLHLPCIFVPAAHETVDGLYSDDVTLRPFTAKLIPYFAFANRGETDMRIWVS